MAAKTDRAGIGGSKPDGLQPGVPESGGLEPKDLASGGLESEDLVSGEIEPLADHTANQARRVVASYAEDADECRMFLAMLGIGPSKPEA